MKLRLPMHRRRLISFAAIAAFAIARTSVAQQTGILSGVVRTTAGDSLPGAPVHATAPGIDTTVRANARGRYEVALPFGPATVQATSMGYAPKVERVTVNRAATQLDLVLSRTAQQLSGVDVRDKWTGVRGGVGDETTRAPLPGVSITSLRQKLSAETDSNGRFEIGMKTGERTLFELAHVGYKTRIVSLDIAEGETKDVVYFLKPGQDLKYMKTALNDLAHRAATTQLHGFMDGHEHLARHHAPTLLDAVQESGLLVKKGLVMGNCIFLFVDGQPRPGFPVSSVNMADVDFVEVYASEGSLASEWGTTKCTPNPDIPPPPKHGRAPASYISVWMKH